MALAIDKDDKNLAKYVLLIADSKIPAFVELYNQIAIDKTNQND